MSLELFVSKLCIGYFLWSFARSSIKKQFWNDCSKFSCSKRSVAKLSLLLCSLRVGENNLPSTLFKIYRPTEFNKKCVSTKETAARNLCNERLGVYFAKDYLWTVFTRVLLWNPQAYTKEVGECQQASFLSSQIKLCLISKCLSKHSVKTRCWIFFVLRNADFLSSKISRNSLEERVCSWEFYTESK